MNFIDIIKNCYFSNSYFQSSSIPQCLQFLFNSQKIQVDYLSDNRSYQLTQLLESWSPESLLPLHELPPESLCGKFIRKFNPKTFLQDLSPSPLRLEISILPPSSSALELLPSALLDPELVINFNQCGKSGQLFVQISFSKNGWGYDILDIP